MSDQPSGQPRKPQTPTPHEGTSVGETDGQAKNGIPDHGGEEATAYPNSDRQKNETTPGKS